MNKLQIYTEILNSVMESILIVDNDNKILFSNPTLHQLFEVDSDEDLTGRDFLDFVVKEHWDIVSKQTDTRKSGESSRYELKILTAKNNIKWASLSVCPRMNKQGKTIGSFATVVDITKMKMLQFELTEILNSVMESILIVDNDNKIEFSNPTLHQLFEVDSAEDLTGRNFLDFVVEEHWDIVTKQTDTRKSGESSRYELKIVTAKNNIKWASLSVSPRLDEQGKTIGAVATVVDITKMKMLQFELTEILNSVMESILIVDNDNKIEFSNPTLHQLFEVDSAEDLTGRNFLDFVVEEHWDIVTKQTDTRKSGESSRYELKIVTAKNNIKWASLSVCPRLDEQGNTIGAVATVVDITKMKLMQLDLAESEERFRDIALCTADWLWETDQNGTYTFCSEMVIDCLGYSADEIIGKTPFDFMPPDDKKYMKKRYLNIFNSMEKIVNLESRIVHKHGYMKIFLTNGIPIKDLNGNLIGYRGVDKDITIQKLAEAEISRAQVQTEKKNTELKAALSIAKKLTQQARHANQTNSVFLAKMNHEITSAINDLIKMTDILLGTGLTPKQTDFASQIKLNAKELKSILKDAEIKNR